MAGVLNFSEAAALAMHSVELLSHSTGRSITSSELAGVLHCSSSHLAKVMQRLVRTGIVASTRGPGGGFRLGPRAAEASLLEIYESIDGQLTVGQCLLGKDSCAISGCWFGQFSARVSERVRADLAERKLSHLASQ